MAFVDEDGAGRCIKEAPRLVAHAGVVATQRPPYHGIVAGGSKPPGQADRIAVLSINDE